MIKSKSIQYTHHNSEIHHNFHLIHFFLDYTILLDSIYYFNKLYSTIEIGMILFAIPREGAVELEPVQDYAPVALGKRRAVEGMLGDRLEAVEFVLGDGPDRIRTVAAAAGGFCHIAFVPRPARPARLV